MHGNMNNIFCMVEEGIIYQVDTYNKVAIGYTNDLYNSLEETTNEYYEKLVELGVIVPPKTQDEINQELMQELNESRKATQETQKALSEALQLLKSLNDKEGVPNVRSNSRKPKAEVS